MEGDGAALSPHLETLEQEIQQKEKSISSSNRKYPSISKQEAEKMSFEKGKINYHRQWFLGFQKKLIQWDSEIREAAKELEKEGTQLSILM